MTHPLPATLVPIIAQADRDGRAVVTVLGGRLAIIMPIRVTAGSDADAARLERYVEAIQAALDSIP